MLHKTAQRLRRHKRIRSTIYGTKDRPRLVVFRSNTHIYAQLIDDDNQTTLVTANDTEKDVKGKKYEEKEKGFTKINTAYAVGKALADKAKKKNITAIVFDRGGFIFTGRVRAVLNGARDGGLQV